MTTIYIDGDEFTLENGEHINAIQAAARFGIEIPYYCWHPALSVVANCRMCEVEVGSRDPKTGEIRMLPKLVPACQTPAKDQTVLITKSPKVLEHRRMIMELLLLNHPLDCPVCDQAGECGLQDFSYDHGRAEHRFVETRNVNPRKDVSDRIQLNADRCIMCTRCVRFTREITRTGELQVMRRGEHAEIGVFPEYELDNPLAGNVVDICPVGALLDKDFLHKQRVWFLSKHDSICTGCSTGCNITVEENKGAAWRHKPRYNPHVNDYWICDEGRYGYKVANDPELLDATYVLEDGDHRATPIDQAIAAVSRNLALIAREGGKIAAIVSPFLTVEEAYLLCKYIKAISPSSVLAIGPIPRSGEDATWLPDKSQGRTGDVSFVVCRPFTIRAEKCPNRRGVEEVVRHFQGEVIDYASIGARIGGGEFQAAYVTSNAPEPAFDESAATTIRRGVSFLVVQDTRITPLANQADVVLAGGTYAEKAGCYVNHDGRLQFAEAALPPREGVLPDLDVFSILLERGAAPIRSFDVLAELAAEIEVFAVAAGGRIAEFGGTIGGVESNRSAPKNGSVYEQVYQDPWAGVRR